MKENIAGLHREKELLELFVIKKLQNQGYFIKNTANPCTLKSDRKFVIEDDVEKLRFVKFAILGDFRQK